jgi:hypothetical protein
MNLLSVKNFGVVQSNFCCNILPEHRHLFKMI